MRKTTGARRPALGPRRWTARWIVRIGAASFVLACVVPREASAQIAPSAGLPMRPVPRVMPELRLDAIAGARDQLQLGAGAIVRLGTYARGVLIAGGGVARADHDTRGSARAEGVVRFLLDPLRERRWGLYGGAGVGASWVDGDGWRTPLVVLLGVEGGDRSGHAFAAELGLGGGVRLGLVIRRTSDRRR